MYEKKIPVKNRSGVDVTFYVIEGKWKRDIILCLNNGIKRPIELQKHLAEAKANARVLNQQLKELEKYNIIYKKIYPSVPPKVEYYLTDIGKELIPLFQIMEKWGNNYSKKLESLDSPAALNGFHIT
jgi:DNA-binding HxlR family transcriptional regulator